MAQLTNKTVWQYAQPIAKKGPKAQPTGETQEPKKLSNHAQRNLDERRKSTRAFSSISSPDLTSSSACLTDLKIDNLLETQFAAGRLYAILSSRPGQAGRADGYILEGKELEVCFPFPIS